MSRASTHTKQANQLRIIGGAWRGRKLAFPSATGLRPTPDRVRETLFNWLATTLPGARCLDLFAGSGALGFEALSRGAAHADLVDNNPIVVAQLRANATLLNTRSAEVWPDSAAHWLAAPLRAHSRPYDIIFLDPPFHMNWVAVLVPQLAHGPLLTAGSMIYLETGKDEALPPLPAHWQLHREKVAGQVCYRLFVVGAS